MIKNFVEVFKWIEFLKVNVFCTRIKTNELHIGEIFPLTNKDLPYTCINNQYRFPLLSSYKKTHDLSFI